MKIGVWDEEGGGGVRGGGSLCVWACKGNSTDHLLDKTDCIAPWPLIYENWPFVF